MGFKDLENKVKDLMDKDNSSHQKAVQQSIDPATELTDTQTDVK